MSFELSSGVAHCGGCLEWRGTILSDRPAFGSARSILTGDLKDDDAPNFGNIVDNGVHVIQAIATDAAARLV